MVQARATFDGLHETFDMYFPRDAPKPTKAKTG